MKAIWTPRYGSASILEVRDVPDPIPGPGEALVQVSASPITAGDLRLRTANFPGISALFGRLLIGLWGPRAKIQGTGFAGRIVAVGAAVRRFAVGDVVFGSVNAGAWAERLIVDANGAIAHLPDNVPAEHAAATPYGAGTALHFLRDLADVQPGEHALILGGSGGVGRFAIPIAKHLGARVTAVGSRASADLMKQLGADAVLDYRTQDFTQTGETYDVILDIADASSFARSRRALTPRGRYLTLHISLGAFFHMARTRLFGGPKSIFAISIDDQPRTETLGAWLAAGVFTPRIAARYPLERISEAHARAETDAHGSVIVTMSPAEARPRVRVEA